MPWQSKTAKPHGRQQFQFVSTMATLFGLLLRRSLSLFLAGLALFSPRAAFSTLRPPVELAHLAGVIRNCLFAVPPEPGRFTASGGRTPYSPSTAHRISVPGTALLSV